MTFTLTLKGKPDASSYKQISDNAQEKNFTAEKGKVVISHKFCFTSKQLSNDTIKRLMQYLIFPLLITNFRRYK